MGEWRRLNLNFLRQRIQRLVVLMDLSEPGTVPDSGMLASLIDLVRMYTYNYDVMCILTTVHSDHLECEMYYYTHTHVHCKCYT